MPSKYSQDKRRIYDKWTGSILSVPSVKYGAGMSNVSSQILISLFKNPTERPKPHTFSQNDRFKLQEPQTEPGC